MIMRKALTSTVLAALLLSVSPLLTHEAAAQSKKSVEQTSSTELNAAVKATIETIGTVMPDIKDYEIISIRKNEETTVAGKIEVFQIEMMGAPHPVKPNYAYLRINADTGELIIAEIQNGLPSTNSPLSDQEAESQASTYLETLLGDKAEDYTFSKVYTYTLGENNDKPVTVVTFESDENSVHLALHGNGELGRFLKDIYPPE